MDTIPEGYYPLRAYSNGEYLVIEGIPNDPKDWPEDDERRHNCDIMGCGQAHVIIRQRLSHVKYAGRLRDMLSDVSHIVQDIQVEHYYQIDVLTDEINALISLADKEEFHAGL